MRRPSATWQGAAQRLAILAFAVTALSVSSLRAADSTALAVHPTTVELRGNFARVQLLVTGAATVDAARLDDLTATCTFASSAPGVCRVDERGQITAVAHGKAEIRIKAGKRSARVAVTVSGVAPNPTVNYTTQIAPILSRAGCNMGACHAAQYGQAGFKLSVFGFEPAADHEAMVRDRSQRRVSFLEPESSMLLRKPTMQLPHGGGRRLDRESPEYATLVAWIASGAPGPQAKDPKPTKIDVFPPRRITTANAAQQLRVEAKFSDGAVRDVTALAKFNSMDEGVVAVDNGGRVSTKGQGQGNVLVRFEGQAEIATFIVPYADRVPLAGWKNQNFVDELASAKFRELGIEPAPLCDDETFLRRAFLDAIGTTPTIEQARAFLASKDEKKREQLVDRLLGLTGDPQLDTFNDSYVAWWTLKWSDLVRNQSNDLGEQGMWALHNWLREAFRANKPFDKIVRELLTATGSIYSNGPANFFRVNADATERAEAAAQLFLGIRLQCAKCHHHPFEKYGQEDYYSFASYFARVGTKPSQEFGLFGQESVVVVNATGDLRHPKTGALMKPKPLEGSVADTPRDPRQALAAWITSPTNAFFARAVVNRYVGYLLGRGLVDPLDDLRATNPPSNPELMKALARHLVDHKFDLKQLIRAIMTSRLYGLDSQPSKENRADRRFFSHFTVKRLSAEALLDSVDRAAGTQTKFTSLPLGIRAIELPDGEYQDYFLKTFGKPVRASVCECERSPDESLAQALHTLNGEILTGKIGGPTSRIAGLLAAKKSPEAIVEEIYLATLSRYPTAAEKQSAAAFLKESGKPKECLEDLQWALMNSKDFLFIH